MHIINATYQRISFSRKKFSRNRKRRWTRRGKLFFWKMKMKNKSSSLVNGQNTITLSTSASGTGSFSPVAISVAFCYLKTTGPQIPPWVSALQPQRHLLNVSDFIFWKTNIRAIHKTLHKIALSTLHHFLRAWIRMHDFVMAGYPERKDTR